MCKGFAVESLGKTVAWLNAWTLIAWNCLQYALRTSTAKRVRPRPQVQTGNTAVFAGAATASPISLISVSRMNPAADWITQIVDVDPEEAQILIDLVELLFEDWYVARNDRTKHLAKIRSIAEEKKQKQEPAQKLDEEMPEFSGPNVQVTSETKDWISENLATANTGDGKPRHKCKFRSLDFAVRNYPLNAQYFAFVLPQLGVHFGTGIAALIINALYRRDYTAADPSARWRWLGL
jgi:hypothetical protein